MAARTFQHTPVLLNEAMELLQCRPGGVYVDATVGGCGYIEAILERTSPDGVVLGVDWDAKTLAAARMRLQDFRRRVILRRADFARLPETMLEFGLGPVDGIVADLGISSLQLDDPERGFSFQQDGPLDMRMDQSRMQTAADLVNSLPEKQLSELILSLGEERWARRIARAIVLRRPSKAFTRTRDLAEVITEVVPKSADARRIHPATRTFQALRLAVNQELVSVELFLGGVLDLLKPGGRLCIIAFHSLEDRLVKQYFRRWASSCRCAPELPRCQCSGQPLVRLLTRKALRPQEQELRGNPRSRSGRLRAVEKC
ncbi:MAG TPA: 16S rRNA (cytosine(1402)-N(4))-methyltransferase [Syntrophobacteraceae bacterium]|nr:16S rRNA (cytosine(1402)-N(4))-methyltransferase [Syntrophobacteraceae bacterium]